MLLGQQIEAFTDHKNLAHKHFNTERVMRWWLFLEEFGPKLTHVKGVNTIVADALTWLDMSEEEFSAEAFTGELANWEQDIPEGYPLSYEELVCRKKKDRALQNKFKMEPELHIKKPFTFSDDTYELITKNDKTCVPKYLQHKCAKWYHLTLMHPGNSLKRSTSCG